MGTALSAKKSLAVEGVGQPEKVGKVGFKNPVM
jgi:hypothetical protein